MKSCFSFHTGVPGTVDPDFDKPNVTEFKQTIDKMKLHLSFEEYSWWIDFCDKPNEYGVKRSSWPLLEIRPVHKIILVPSTVSSVNNTVIHTLLDNERNRPKVGCFIFQYVQNNN